ncbi:unnamed protein product, partial [Ixodes pacificus]
MAGLQTAYRALPAYDQEVDTPPQESSFLIHTVPDSSRTRWNHVEDLDSFFTRISFLAYHQKHGLTCMVLYEVLELLQFLFVVLFTTYLVQCVDYPVLFKDRLPAHNSTKVTLGDVLVPLGRCTSRLSPSVVLFLVVAFVFWTLRAVKVAFQLLQFVEIRAFYLNALHISSNDLDNMTWHEVQRRLLDVQKDQQMCIHKTELTELDIYHRILRYKNYMVAMVNKEVLPLRFTLPLLGEVIFLTHGLKFNLQVILFWGPWAPFENNWHLKEEYKRGTHRETLANELSKHILWVGLANLVFLPVILVWQVLYSFFSYADIIKREPGFLGSRMWSLYGRLYLRHFNELDHELNTRQGPPPFLPAHFRQLCRGYRPASQYMGIFTSHLMNVLAKNAAFFAGSILAVLLALTVYDEDVLTVEHVLSIITVLGMIVAVCRAVIPDEHLVWCPERLMTNILAQVHYMPDHWKGQCHTYAVRDEFAHLFQYKAVHLLEELLSPLVTPLVLCCVLRHRAPEIVDFLRNFTVEVVGVGDVCSFAQMDIRRHGCPQWTAPDAVQEAGDASPQQQAQHGKTELSLMHFTLTNPNWVPPGESTAFLSQLKEQVNKDAARLPTFREDNPLYYSLNSLSSLGVGYSSLAASILRPPGDALSHSQAGGLAAEPVRGGLSHTEGPLGVLPSQGGLLASLHALNDPCGAPGSNGEASLESTVTHMSFSTLYMHELHQRQLKRSACPEEAQSRLVWQQRPPGDLPHIPESPQEGDEGRPLLPPTTGP